MTRDGRRTDQSGWVLVWDGLSQADRLLVNGIMSNPFIVGRMHLAWSQILRDDLERQFWIYGPSAREMKIGQIWTGTQDAGDPRAYYERLFLQLYPVANYHTHPGRTWPSSYPSTGDSNYSRGSGTIGILQTRFGFTFGRTTHHEWKSR